MKQAVVGIDIGGTNTVFGIIDRKGDLLGEETVSTQDYPDPRRFSDVLCEKIRLMQSRLPNPVDLVGVGIGAPNGNYYSGAIEQAPNLVWQGKVPLAKWIGEGMEIPCLLTNDANAAAFGEMRFGAAKDMQHFVLITLGTGLGSGIVVEGKMVYGYDGFAGEIGHTIVRPGGRMCTCGRRGCLEAYVSARGIKETLGKFLAESKEESMWSKMPWEAVTVQKIHEAARDGNELARRAFARTGRILGEKLADTVNYTSPEAFILTGGIAHAGDLLFIPCQESLEANLLNIYQGRIKVILSELVDRNAGLLGAAALIWDKLLANTNTRTVS